MEAKSVAQLQRRMTTENLIHERAASLRAKIATLEEKMDRQPAMREELMPEADALGIELDACYQTLAESRHRSDP